MGKKTAKTTEQTLRIIDTIQREDGVRIANLEEKVDLSRTALYNHLNALSNHGYLTKEGEFYHIGLRFLNRGEYSRNRKYGYILADDVVQELAEQTKEEVGFYVENNDRAIIVHGSYHPESRHTGQEGHQMNQKRSEGNYFNLHTIAAGKSILAQYEDSRVNEIIDRRGLPKEAKNTITDREEFFRELEEVREQGVSFANEEFENGLRSVGRRILGPSGSVLGAISISAPTYREDSGFENRYPTILCDMCDKLEDDIEEKYLDTLGP